MQDDKYLALILIFCTISLLFFLLKLYFELVKKIKVSNKNKHDIKFDFKKNKYVFDKNIAVKQYFIYWIRIILIQILIFLFIFLGLPEIIKFNELNFYPIVILEFISAAIVTQSIISMILTFIIWSKNTFLCENKKIIQYIHHYADKYNNYEESDYKRVYKIIKISNVKVNRGYIILKGDFSYKDEINTDIGFNHTYDEKHTNKLKIPRIYTNDDELVKTCMNLLINKF